VEALNGGGKEREEEGEMSSLFSSEGCEHCLKGANEYFLCLEI
jgi:hypothetical protein